MTGILWENALNVLNYWLRPDTFSHFLWDFLWLSSNSINFILDFISLYKSLAYLNCRSGLDL